MRPLPNEVILASAGTGKTFNLSNRFISILMRDPTLDPARILAATFTRKAAGEILDRVIQRVVEAATIPKKADELSSLIGIEDAGTEAYRDLCVKLARSFHRLGISTIDAFVARIATCLGGDIGLPHGWRICEEDEDDVLRSNASDAMLDRAEPKELWELFQLWYSGGFGRDPHHTLMTISKALHHALVESGGREEPWIRGVKPIAVLDAEVKAALHHVASGDIVGVKNGKPIARIPPAIEKVQTLCRSADWCGVLTHTLIANCLGGNDSYYKVEFAKSFGDSFRTIGRAAVAHALDELAARNRAAFALIRGFDGAYQELKDARSLFRFDDIPRRILSADFDEQLIHLYFRLDSEIKHVLLDEFQDTSVLQFKLFEPIISEILDQHDAERSFFCVGDVKQSLYSWRGARSDLLAGLHERWESLERRTLERSFRSSPLVLNFVNSVFANIDERWQQVFESDGSELAAGAWESRWKPHESAKQSYKGRASVVRVCADSDGRPAKSLLSDAVVDQVQKLHDAHPEATIAILVRRNALIQHYIYELGRIGIVASGDGKSCLTDAGCVSAAASLFHLADHPKDTAAFAHIASGPFARLFGIQDIPSDERKLKDEALKLSRLWRRRVSAEGLVKCVQFLLRSVAGEIDARSFSRFEQLVGLAVKAQSRRDNGPGDFAAMIRKIELEDIQPARVRVMTIHQSKGLEFNCVVIAELVTKKRNNTVRLLTDRLDSNGNRNALGAISDVSVCPPAGLIKQDKRLTEMSRMKACEEAMSELCVLYVAMTRATHSLDIFIEGAKEGKISTAWSSELVLNACNTNRAGVGIDVVFSKEEEGWTDTIEVSKANTRGTLEVDVGRPLAAKIMHPLRWSRRSPSSLEGGAEKKLGDLLSIEPQHGRRRGTVIHKFCEMVGWVDQGIPTLAELIQIARSFGMDDADAAKEAEWLIQRISGPFADVLSSSRYPIGSGTKLRREWSFAVPVIDKNGERSMLNGSVDRLVTIAENGKVVRAEIFDFKTDRVAEVRSDSFKQRVMHYAPQMAAYREAVALVFGIPSKAVATTLLMLESGEGISVDP